MALTGYALDLEVEPLMNLAEEWVLAARRHRVAEVDVAMCRTRTDFDNRDKAERAVYDAKDAFEVALREALSKR